MLAKLIVLPICLLLLILMMLVMLGVEEAPSLKSRAELTSDQIGQVKRLLDRNDPRRLKTGTITTARLGQQELDLALNYAVKQYANGVAKLKIEQGKAFIEASLPIKLISQNGYLNVQLTLKQTDALPTVSAMLLGKLPIPGFVATAMIKKYSLSTMHASLDWQQIARLIRKITFHPLRLNITYRWQKDLPNQLTGALLSQDELNQIKTYHQYLARLTQSGSGPLNLIDLMKSLFQLASKRSQDNDAITENRAVIRVLAFYVVQKDLGKLTSQSTHWLRSVWRQVKLQGRDDFSKHYLVSAFLAADAGSPLADAVGLYKEIVDARGGSGFSFNDIAADRAGTRLGELATTSQQQALKIQLFMTTASEDDIMPDTTGLPEFLSEAEFKHRYGGLEGDAYRKMIDDIDGRIFALAINRR